MTRGEMTEPRRSGSRVAVAVVLALAVVVPLGMVGAVPLFLGPALGADLGAVCEPGSHPSNTDATNADADSDAALVVQSAEGMAVPLHQSHLANAHSMVSAATQHGADQRALLIMLMTALQESKLRNLANPDAVPESAGFPNDGVGHDHDSLGVLQQRPSMSWGEVGELMDPAYAAVAFLGGPHGPNNGSPAGLFDLHGWESAGLGVAAQRVQVSAFPDAYEQWFEAAVVVLDHVGGATSVCAAAHASGAGSYPLASPAVITDGVGPRPCRVAAGGGCASSTWHPALDFGAVCGEPVLAARPGTVTVVSDYWVSVVTDDGTIVSYLHMFPGDVDVALGDIVDAGQRIGAVGNAGPSTGCHLDFRVNALGTTDPAVGALPHLGDGSVAAGFVDPEAYMALYGVDLL